MVVKEGGDGVVPMKFFLCTHIVRGSEVLSEKSWVAEGDRVGRRNST